MGRRRSGSSLPCGEPGGRGEVSHVAHAAQHAWRDSLVVSVDLPVPPVLAGSMPQPPVVFFAIAVAAHESATCSVGEILSSPVACSLAQASSRHAAGPRGGCSTSRGLEAIRVVGRTMPRSSPLGVSM